MITRDMWTYLRTPVFRRFFDSSGIFHFFPSIIPFLLNDTPSRTHTQEKPPPPFFTCRTTLLRCLYKLHNGQSFYCAPYAPRRSRRRCVGPSVWVAATPFARCASTSCTARLVPLTRRPSILTSSSCPSTRPCYSWSGVRWGISTMFTE